MDRGSPICEKLYPVLPSNYLILKMNLVSMSMVPVFQSQFVQNTERNVTRFHRSYLGLVCCRRWIVAQSAAVEWRLEMFVAGETRTETRGSGEGPRQGRGGRYVIGSLHIRWKLHHITKIILLVPVAHKSLDIIIIVFMVSYLYLITLYPHRSLGGWLILWNKLWIDSGLKVVEGRCVFR